MSYPARAKGLDKYDKQDLGLNNLTWRNQPLKVHLSWVDNTWIFDFLQSINRNETSSISWGCIIHRPYICRGVIRECPVYDTKPTEGEAPDLKFRGMWSTLSLPLLPGLLWPCVVVPDWVLFTGQIELFDCKKKNILYWNKLLEIVSFDHLTVCKQIAGF